MKLPHSGNRRLLRREKGNDAGGNVSRRGGRQPPRGPGLGRREEADALPTLQAPRPPAPRTGAPSSPQGAVLHLSPRCALCGGPVWSCPAVPPAPGPDTPHGPPTSATVRPGRAPSVLSVGRLSAAPAHPPSGTHGGPRCGRPLRAATCPEPSAGAPAMCPPGAGRPSRVLRPPHSCDVPSGDGPCRGQGSAWLQRRRGARPPGAQRGQGLTGTPSGSSCPVRGHRRARPPPTTGTSTRGLHGHQSFKPCETLFHKFQGLWPYLDRDSRRD